MANKSISQLTAGAAVSGTDLFPDVQTAGVGPVKVTATQLATFFWYQPTLVAPSLGAATASSIAIAGATLGSNVLAVNGTTLLGGATTVSTGGLTIGVQQTTQGSLVLANTAAGAYPTTIQSSNSASAAWTLTLPTTAGSSGFILTTNGSGVTSWTNPTALGVDLDVGSTAITNGTAGRLLFEGAGNVLQESANLTFSTAALTLGVQQTAQGSIVLANTAAGAFATTLQSSNSATAAVTYTFPTAAPASNGYVLSATTAGVMSWVDNATALVVGTSAITGGTTGRVLYDNAGVLGEYTAVPVGFGGTGTSTAFTAGSVVFAGASGVYSQDNANFFWDDSNNRLGIGTTAPASKLQIGSSSTGTQAENIDMWGNLAGSNGDIAKLRFFNVQAFNTKQIAQISAARDGNNYGGSLIFSTGTQADTTLTERMRIDSVGNLLLGGTAARGTTAGTYHLDIFNGTAPAGTLTNGISLYSSSGDFNFMDSSGNGYKVGFRNVPPVGTKTGSYSLATGDVGKYVQVGSGGSITIPDATFAEGDIISIFNNTTGNITITCTITTAYIAGTDTDKATMTLATRGVATILFISSTVCVVSGNVT